MSVDAGRLLSDFDRLVEAVEALISLAPVKRHEREPEDDVILMVVADYAFQPLDPRGRRAQAHALRLFRDWSERFKLFLRSLPDHEAKELGQKAAEVSRAWIEHADNCFGLQHSQAASMKAFREEVQPLRDVIEPFVDDDATADSSATPSPSGRRFRVALSFAGEKRPFVERVAAELAHVLGKDPVLYDRFHEEEFAQPRLAFKLPALYKDADLVAVFTCRDYDRKEWPGLEWRKIFELIQERHDQQVILFRWDRVLIEGLGNGDGFLELDGREPGIATAAILKRLARLDEQHGVAPDTRESKLLVAPAPPTPPTIPAAALEVFRAFLDKKGGHDRILLESFHREIAPMLGERRFQLGVEQAKAAGLLRAVDGVVPALYLADGGRSLLLEHPELIDDDPPAPRAPPREPRPPRVKVLGRGFHNADFYVGDVWWEGKGDDMELTARLWAGPTGDVCRGVPGGTLIARVAKDVPTHHAWAVQAIVSGDYHRQGRARDLSDAQEQVLDALDEIIPGIRGLIVDKPPMKNTLKGRFSNRY